MSQDWVKNIDESPDTAFAVHEVSKTLASPADADLRRLRRLCKCLLGTQKAWNLDTKGQTILNILMHAQMQTGVEIRSTERAPQVENSRQGQLRRVVVPAVTSLVRELQGVSSFLASAAASGKRRTGCFYSADLLVNRRHSCMWNCAICLRDDPSIVFSGSRSRKSCLSLTQGRVAIQCECGDQFMSPSFRT